jgi:hypothetical protein
MAMDQLLMLFKGAQDSRRHWSHHQSFRRSSLRSPSSKTGGVTMQIPVLLSPLVLLFCSPRDIVFSGRHPADAAGAAHLNTILGLIHLNNAQ